MNFSDRNFFNFFRALCNVCCMVMGIYADVAVINQILQVDYCFSFALFVIVCFSFVEKEAQALAEDFLG